MRPLSRGRNLQGLQATVLGLARNVRRLRTLPALLFLFCGACSTGSAESQRHEITSSINVNELPETPTNKAEYEATKASISVGKDLTLYLHRNDTEPVAAVVITLTPSAPKAFAMHAVLLDEDGKSVAAGGIDSAAPVSSLTTTASGPSGVLAQARSIRVVWYDFP